MQKQLARSRPILGNTLQKARPAKFGDTADQSRKAATTGVASRLTKIQA